MLRAMWKSLTNHIQDFHEGHSDLYPKCAHGHLDEYDRDKEWLQPCEIYKPIKFYKTTVLTSFLFILWWQKLFHFIFAFQHQRFVRN